MRYSGQSYWYEAYCKITEAVVTPARISIDYEDEDGSEGHLEAFSQDQIHYRGTYGYPSLEPSHHVEFTLFRSGDGRIALVGRWWWDGGEGNWLIQLTLSGHGSRQGTDQ